MARVGAGAGRKTGLLVAATLSLAACGGGAPKAVASAPAGGTPPEEKGTTSVAATPPPEPLAPNEVPKPEPDGASKAAPTVPPTAEPVVRTEAVESPSSLGGSNLEDGREPKKSLALPRLTLRHIGMHIGGESNSSESKKPWLTALEREEVGFLRCYRSVKEPMTGGTFGVDLYVGLEGGAPVVKKTRHKLGGDDFDFCMRDVFSVVRFPRPVRATMLSYSLRFEIKP
jgi:hypothetical protein